VSPPPTPFPSPLAPVLSCHQVGRLFLERTEDKAALCNARDADSKTPFDLAVQNKHNAVCKLLKEVGGGRPQRAVRRLLRHVVVVVVVTVVKRVVARSSVVWTVLKEEGDRKGFGRRRVDSWGFGFWGKEVESKRVSDRGGGDGHVRRFKQGEAGRRPVVVTSRGSRPRHKRGGGRGVGPSRGRARRARGCLCGCPSREASGFSTSFLYLAGGG
jgi:hypothetical protein